MKAKAKRQKSIGCGCIDSINEQLKEHNTYVPRELVMNFKTGASRLGLMIPTRKIDSKNRNPAVQIQAKFCPVCGEPVDKTMRKERDQ